MVAIEPTREADFTFAGPFTLDGGGELSAVTLHYTLYGKPNARRDNVILACHALSGSARIGDWWSDLFGSGLPFDTDHYCIVGINVLGSCYGSTGPISIDSHTGQRYGSRFPHVSIRDMVRAQARLLDHLEIERPHAIIGGSIGGMQALAWASEYPDRVPLCVAIGACPLSGMGLGLNHLQREMIRRDPRWRGGDYPPDDPPTAGLALARGLAMCTYKSPELFQNRFGRRLDRNGTDEARDPGEGFEVHGYLDHQGRTFVNRFDANCYLTLTKAMDTFELTDTDLRRIRARTHLIGIASDWLFPPADVRHLAVRMQAAGTNTHYDELASMHGHDGFLADAKCLAPLITRVLA